MLAPAADEHARVRNAQGNWIGLEGAATAWLAISFVVWCLDPWRGSGSILRAARRWNSTKKDPPYPAVISESQSRSNRRRLQMLIRGAPDPRKMTFKMAGQYWQSTGNVLLCGLSARKPARIRPSRLITPHVHHTGTDSVDFELHTQVQSQSKTLYDAWHFVIECRRARSNQQCS